MLYNHQENTFQERAPEGKCPPGTWIVKRKGVGMRYYMNYKSREYIPRESSREKWPQGIASSTAPQTRLKRTSKHFKRISNTSPTHGKHTSTACRTPTTITFVYVSWWFSEPSCRLLLDIWLAPLDVLSSLSAIFFGTCEIEVCGPQFMLAEC